MSLKYLNNTCKKCDAEISNTHYFKNKDNPEFLENWKKKSRSYYAEHAEEIKAKRKLIRQTPEYKKMMKEYRERNKARIYEQEVITKRRYHEKNKNEISDKYIINQLVNQGYGKKEDVSKNKDLIAYEKSKILLHRLKQQIYVTTN